MDTTITRHMVVFTLAKDAPEAFPQKYQRVCLTIEGRTTPEDFPNILKIAVGQPVNVEYHHPL